MARRQPVLALRHMRTLFGVGAVGGLTDRQLLDQFSTAHREAAEAAFTTLVERHGPMVLRVCRGVLGDSHDVHDAFQATFLVLVRKSGSLWVRDSLGPWLHGVAFRVATKAKVAAARRKRARAPAPPRSPRAGRGDGRDDLASTLHEEVNRLPPKYREPIVLCYLEGLTHEGAATALGWPVGTVSGRLARARDLLRARLVRRGLAPSAGTLGALLSAKEASATTPVGIGSQVRHVAGGGAVGRGGAGGGRGSGESMLEDDDHGGIEDSIDPAPRGDRRIRPGQRGPNTALRPWSRRGTKLAGGSG